MPNPSGKRPEPIRAAIMALALVAAAATGAGLGLAWQKFASDDPVPAASE